MPGPDQNSTGLENCLNAAAGIVQDCLNRHRGGTVSVGPATLTIDHPDGEAGRHRTRFRYNSTIGTFDAVWFCDPDFGGTNIYLGERRRLSKLIEPVLGRITTLSNDPARFRSVVDQLRNADKLMDPIRTKP